MLVCRPKLSTCLRNFCEFCRGCIWGESVAESCRGAEELFFVDVMRFAYSIHLPLIGYDLRIHLGFGDVDTGHGSVRGFFLH